MKKCVKCGRQYEDAVLTCNICDLYLIKDIASEAKSKDIESSRKSGVGTSHIENNTPQTSRINNGRRKRVVTVEDYEETNRTSSNNSVGRTIFVSSDEDDFKPVYNEDNKRSAKHRRRTHKLGRRLLPLVRIILPVVLIVITAVLVVVNWATIREFLRACIVGALIGGTVLTFLSLRFGRYFNPDVVTVGALGGAVVGCILKYNLLGTTVELSELINALMPCAISCVGLWLILRSAFRR